MAVVDRPRQARASNGRLRFLDREQLALLLAAVLKDGLGATERPLYLCAAMTGLAPGRADRPALVRRRLKCPARARRRQLHARFVRDAQVRAVSAIRADSAAARGRPARAPRALGLHRRGRLRLLSPPDRRRLRRAEAAQALPGRARARRLREITFHELRHTFGTQMAAAGAPLRAIQEWMGHADYKTTSVYAHYAPDPTRGAKWAEAALGEPSVQTERAHLRASGMTRAPFPPQTQSGL